MTKVHLGPGPIVRIERTQKDIKPMAFSMTQFEKRIIGQLIAPSSFMVFFAFLGAVFAFAFLGAALAFPFSAFFPLPFGFAAVLGRGARLGCAPKASK